MRTNEQLYSITNRINDDISNLGYDYKDKVLKRSISPYLLKNANISSFIEKIEPIITEIIELPKKLKAFWNFTIDKNDTRFN